MGGQSLANRCCSGMRTYQNFMGSLRSEIHWGTVICTKDIVGCISIFFVLDGLWSSSAVLYMICKRWFPRLNLKITELLMHFKHALMAWMWMSIFYITTNNLGLLRKEYGQLFFPLSHVCFSTNIIYNNLLYWNTYSFLANLVWWNRMCILNSMT